MSKLLKQPVRLALVQLATGFNKADNLARARAKVLEAAANGAQIVVLPECFNSPYGVRHFADYAEQLRTGAASPPTEAEAPSWHALSAMAKDAGAYLIGGSIPERGGGGGGGGDDDDDGSRDNNNNTSSRLYNTSLVFSPTGALLATHRKLHLFDICIPGKITFRESAALSAGRKVTLVELPGYGRIGLGICYDIRFPEPAAIAARARDGDGDGCDSGAFMLVYPAAFNMTTGPLHWRLLARARAVDNQVYVALCSPARAGDEAHDVEYRAWGHSLVVDPNAHVLAEAETGECLVYADLCPERIEQVRAAIPVSSQRRFDVYPDVSRGKIRFEEE